jgi:uncharacterized coiled-coil DUF342 family protein
MGNQCSCQKTPTLDEEYEVALRKALADMKSMLQKEKKTNHVLKHELQKIRNAYELEKRKTSETLVKLKELNGKLILLNDQITELKFGKEKYNEEINRMLKQIDILTDQLDSLRRPRLFGIF